MPLIFCLYTVNISPALARHRYLKASYPQFGMIQSMCSVLLRTHGLILRLSPWSILSAPSLRLHQNENHPLSTLVSGRQSPTWMCRSFLYDYHHNKIVRIRENSGNGLKNPCTRATCVMSNSMPHRPREGWMFSILADFLDARRSISLIAVYNETSKFLRGPLTRCLRNNCVQC